MNLISLIYCTFPDQKSLETICIKLLQEKLIACYNQFDIQSGYWWHLEITKAGEIGCLLKTKPTHLGPAVAALEMLHPYETPCILNWEVTASQKYGAWIESCLDLG